MNSTVEMKRNMWRYGMPSSSNFQTDGSVDSQTMVVRLAPRKIGPKPKNATGFLVGTRTMSKSPEREMHTSFILHIIIPKKRQTTLKEHDDVSWPVVSSLTEECNTKGSAAMNGTGVYRLIVSKRICMSSYCVIGSVWLGGVRHPAITNFASPRRVFDWLFVQALNPWPNWCHEN